MANKATKGKGPLVITQKDYMKTVRIPLPQQTGGRHRDRRDISRRERKEKDRRGEFE